MLAHSAPKRPLYANVTHNMQYNGQARRCSDSEHGALTSMLDSLPEEARERTDNNWARRTVTRDGCSERLVINNVLVSKASRRSKIPGVFKTHRHEHQLHAFLSLRTAWNSEYM